MKTMEATAYFCDEILQVQKDGNWKEQNFTIHPTLSMD